MARTACALRTRAAPCPRSGRHGGSVGGSVCQEVSDARRNLAGMRLEREVTRVEERHRRVGIVAFERLRSRRQEERIVLAPDRQEWRLVGAEILLESRVERDVAFIVAEKVELRSEKGRVGKGGV